jgi:hypothetical protein
MALDYLTIPGMFLLVFFLLLLTLITATSVDVEHIFSRGRLLLSHVRSQMSSRTTRALLCVGIWSQLGLVRDNNVKAVTMLNDIDGKEDQLVDSWDAINI